MPPSFPAPAGSNPKPVGTLALIERLGLDVPAPAVASYLVDSGAGMVEVDGQRSQSFARRIEPKDDLEHLRFALREEPVGFLTMKAILRAIGSEALAEWVRREPYGRHARRAWYLYETLLGERLPVPDLRRGDPVELLDPRQQVTASGRRVARQRIEDNALGDARFCPLVRRTAGDAETDRLRDLVGRTVAEVDPAVLARAIRYLYLKETRSSFEIEGEHPSGQKQERFAAALREVDRHGIGSEAELVALQNLIVDERFRESGFRTIQNYVGESTLYGERVHYPCPKPEDLGSLMDGWFASLARTRASDPIVRAAVLGFGFVFVHPFEDGNGRLHRYIFQKVLAESGFTPPGVLIPISAAIVRDQRAYDAALEAHSTVVMNRVEYELDAQSQMRVTSDTADLYRYFDATPHVEYLARTIRQAIEADLQEELRFLLLFDGAMREVERIVDLPNRDAGLLVRLIVQNGGRLSNKKRKLFAKLRDDEVSRIEDAIGGLGVAPTLPEL